jgi:hypothetical protein
VWLRRGLGFGPFDSDRVMVRGRAEKSSL